MNLVRRRYELLAWSGAALLLAVAFLAASALAARGDERLVLVALIGIVSLPLAIWALTQLDPAVPATTAIVLGVFAGNWGNIGVPPLDRLALLAAVASVAWRRWRTGEPLRLNTGAPLIFLAAASVWAAGSMVLAEQATRVNLIALLDRFTLVGFTLYVLAPTLFPHREQRNILLAGLVGLGVYLAAVALAQGLGGDALVLPKYIQNPALGIHAERARGPFLEAAANGLALFVCAGACYVAARSWRLKWLPAAVGVLCLISIIFTLTRQIWIAAVVATVVTTAMTPDLRRFLVPGGAVGVMAVVVAFAVVPGLQSSADSRAGDKLPVYDRLNSNAAGLRMVADRPLTGFGWGSYLDEVAPYYRLAADYPLTTVGSIHNVALSNAVALGVVGAALWLAGLLTAVWRALVGRRLDGEGRLWWSATLATTVCWAVVANFTPLDYTFANYVLWLLLGVAAATSTGVEARSRRPLR